MRKPEVTHKIMSSIPQKDTEPEILLRKALWKKGLRFRKNYTKLPGRPDIVFTKKKIIVFCDGDYWHGHNWAIRGMNSLEEELEKYTPYWKNKILSNIERDKRNTLSLQSMGYTVIRFWESDIRNDIDHCVQIVCNEVKKRVQDPQ